MKIDTVLTDKEVDDIIHSWAISEYRYSLSYLIRLAERRIQLIEYHRSYPSEQRSSENGSQ